MKFEREKLNEEDIANILVAIDVWIETYKDDTSDYFKERVTEYENLKNKVLGL